jgi:hypothetical protein
MNTRSPTLNQFPMADTGRLLLDISRRLKFEVFLASESKKADISGFRNGRQPFASIGRSRTRPSWLDAETQIDRQLISFMLWDLRYYC